MYVIYTCIRSEASLYMYFTRVGWGQHTHTPIKSWLYCVNYFEKIPEHTNTHAYVCFLTKEGRLSLLKSQLIAHILAWYYCFILH